jgi:hypothetical protein
MVASPLIALDPVIPDDEERGGASERESMKDCREKGPLEDNLIRFDESDVDATGDDDLTSGCFVSNRLSCRLAMFNSLSWRTRCGWFGIKKYSTMFLIFLDLSSDVDLAETIT